MEYSRSGNVIKGQEKAIAKSCYEEDIFPNNHSVSIKLAERERVPLEHLMQKTSRTPHAKKTLNQNWREIH